jgi:Rrf2 family protein
MKLLSKTSIYGIRAALYVASLENKQKYVPIRQISQDLKISFHFLTKILQTLTQHKIMTSYRGPNGGVTFARPPSEITLMDMVAAIESPDFFGGCIMELPGCGEQNPCPLHDYWGPMRNNLKSVFENTHLSELSDRIIQNNLRISHG